MILTVPLGTAYTDHLTRPAKFVATRRPIAEVLERWEHILFPIVLIGLGFFILVSGGAFGF